jgi:hypothetical protein
MPRSTARIPVQKYSNCMLRALVILPLKKCQGGQAVEVTLEEVVGKAEVVWVVVEVVVRAEEV